MNTLVTRPAGLYEVLLRSFVQAVVVADRSGRVVEWNLAAEECIGLSREDVLGKELWHLQASVAPARIPFETARERARTAFGELVQRSESDRGRWHHEDETEILSAGGTPRMLRSDIFPVWLEGELMIVSTLQETDPPRAMPPRGSASPSVPQAPGGSS